MRFVNLNVLFIKKMLSLYFATAFFRIPATAYGGRGQGIEF